MSSSFRHTQYRPEGTLRLRRKTSLILGSFLIELRQVPGGALLKFLARQLRTANGDAMVREDFVGTASDRAYIASYLQGIRSLDPLEIATMQNPITLATAQRADPHLDGAFFDQAINNASDEIYADYGMRIEEVSRDRYYTAAPSTVGVIGGFHDERSLGYQYWYHAAFVASLNATEFSSRVRAAELARSYLHDCLHHSTFRSFRRAIRIPAKDVRSAKDRVPEIYREQYGFNFRNRDNVSYSAGELTARAPETINLNLLMDAVVVVVTSAALKPSLNTVAASTPLEEAVLNEINLTTYDRSLLPRATVFEEAVYKPASAFIEKWGGSALIRVLLTSMISGEIAPARAHFAKLTGNPDAWEAMFKREDFELTMDE